MVNDLINGGFFVLFMLGMEVILIVIVIGVVFGVIVVLKYNKW